MCILLANVSSQRIMLISSLKEHWVANYILFDRRGPLPSYCTYSLDQFKQYINWPSIQVALLPLRLMLFCPVMLGHPRVQSLWRRLWLETQGINLRFIEISTRASQVGVYYSGKSSHRGLLHLSNGIKSAFGRSC